MRLPLGATRGCLDLATRAFRGYSELQALRAYPCTTYIYIYICSHNIGIRTYAYTYTDIHIHIFIQFPLPKPVTLVSRVETEVPAESPSVCRTTKSWTEVFSASLFFGRCRNGLLAEIRACCCALLSLLSLYSLFPLRVPF